MGLTSFPSTATAGSAKTGPTTNNSNIILVDTHHVSASSPGHSAGRIWADSNTSPHTLKMSDGSSWYVIGDMEVRGNRDYGGFEIQDVSLEKLATGSLSATEARIQWDTTLNLVAWGDGTNTFYAGMTRTDASSYVRIPCTLNVTAIGTPATNPSTSTILDDWWQLDAAAESLNCFADAPIPNGWTGANDLILEVECLLLAAETANDTIDLDCTWRSLSDGDLYTKTATAATAASFDIGAGNTQYASHLVSITIDHDDATNPVAVDDRFQAIITHDPTAGANPVAGIIVKDAWLKVPVFNYDD